MFFSAEPADLHILSVLSLTWSSVDRRSDLRPYHALSFRLKGNGTFVRDREAWAAQTGDIFFVPAYYEYTLRAGQEKLIVVHFSGDEPLSESIERFRPQNPAYYERQFVQLYELWSKKTPGHAYGCPALLYKILYGIERELQSSDDKNDRLARAMEYLHENFTDPALTVEQLAALCCVSDTCFRQMFAKAYGLTPKAYINDLKTRYATELLQSGYYGVQEVSDRCGFANVYYFSNFIKKQTGRSPRSWIQ